MELSYLEKQYIGREADEFKKELKGKLRDLDEFIHKYCSGFNRPPDFSFKFSIEIWEELFGKIGEEANDNAPFVAYALEKMVKEMLPHRKI